MPKVAGQRNRASALSTRPAPRAEDRALQGIQEVDQIGFLLIGETDREALIIEVHDVL
jgi:hypothetical protein